MNRRPHVILVIGFALAYASVFGFEFQAKAESSSNEGRHREKQLYWGDLHNHNEIGQIKGSLERTYEIAQSHLDFFCFTPQSQWPDMRDIPQGRTAQFIRGFEAVKANWEKIKDLANEFYKPGKFVPFIGYEVHFNSGDFHIVFPGRSGDLVYLPGIKQWQNFAKNHAAILIPHHLAYLAGWRGWDWKRLDPAVSPIVEMFSEHGNAESDRSPSRYIRHSMGGRHTRSTVQWLWQMGVESGVVASTDDHLGYPGAYGQGLAGVYADSLTRESLMEAMKARRTYAVNADRIRLEFKLNGHWMGEKIVSSSARQIDVAVKGEDVIDRVEVLKNNRVFHRVHPIDQEPGPASWDRPVLLRIEFGWGPWAGFNMPRIADWKFKITVKKGEILSVSPHFQSRPFDEKKWSEVVSQGDRSCEVVSHTSRQDAFEEKPTNDIVLELQGSPETELIMSLTQPKEITFGKSLGELSESSHIGFVGAFSSESVMFHRIVFADNYLSKFTISDREKTQKLDWYQIRVVQTNGSMAWSSPIWVEAE